MDLTVASVNTLNSVLSLIRNKYVTPTPDHQAVTDSAALNLAMKNGRSMKGMQSYQDGALTKIIFDATLNELGGVGKLGAGMVFPTESTDKGHHAFTLAMDTRVIVLTVSDLMLQQQKTELDMARVGFNLWKEFEQKKKVLDDQLDTEFLVGGGTGALANVVEINGSALAVADTYFGTAGYAVPVDDVSRVNLGNYCSILTGATPRVVVANDCLAFAKGDATGAGIKRGKGYLYVTSGTDLASATLTTSHCVAGQNVNSDAVHMHSISEMHSASNTYPAGTGEGGLDRTDGRYADWRAEIIDYGTATASTVWTGQPLWIAFQNMIGDLVFNTGSFDASRAVQQKEWWNGSADLVLADPAGIIALCNESRQHLMVNTTVIPDIWMTVQTVAGVPLVPIRKLAGRFDFCHFGNIWFMDNPLTPRLGGSDKNNFTPVSQRGYQEAVWYRSCQFFNNKPGEDGAIINFTTSNVDPRRA